MTTSQNREATPPVIKPALLMGDIVLLNEFDTKTKGKEFEVIDYNPSLNCPSIMMIDLRAVKGKQELTVNGNWCVFLRSGTTWDDDIPF